MSFPNLVLAGNANQQFISSIGITYDNDTSTVKPAKLTRSKYDIQRQVKTFNVSGGTADRYNDIPYNAVRRIHTFIGYIDVLTASVALSATSGAFVSTNMDLINSALILTETNGIYYNVPLPSTLGPDEASEISTYANAYEDALSWTYGITVGGTTEAPTYTPKTTQFWVVRDINIVDNNNVTSRVTFHFEYIENWKNLADAIDAATP